VAVVGQVEEDDPRKIMLLQGAGLTIRGADITVGSPLTVTQVSVVTVGSGRVEIGDPLHLTAGVTVTTPPAAPVGKIQHTPSRPGIMAARKTTVMHPLGKRKSQTKLSQKLEGNLTLLLVVGDQVKIPKDSMMILVCQNWCDV